MRSEGSIEIDGFKLKYRTEGSGQDVVVIGSSIYYPRSFSQNLWDSLRPKFKNLTVRIFEKSAHSPQYEEAELFDAELLKWLEET